MAMPPPLVKKDEDQEDECKREDVKSKPWVASLALAERGEVPDPRPGGLCKTHSIFFSACDEAVVSQRTAPPLLGEATEASFSRDASSATDLTWLASRNRASQSLPGAGYLRLSQ